MPHDNIKGDAIYGEYCSRNHIGSSNSRITFIFQYPNMFAVECVRTTVHGVLRNEFEYSFHNNWGKKNKTMSYLFMINSRTIYWWLTAVWSGLMRSWAPPYTIRYCIQQPLHDCWSGPNTPYDYNTRTRYCNSESTTVIVCMLVLKMRWLAVLQ